MRGSAPHRRPSARTAWKAASLAVVLPMLAVAGVPSARGAVSYPLVPRSLSAPAIAGKAVEGQTLTETHAAWTGDPTGFAYQWEVCDGYGQACAAIAGATTETYTLTATDTGHTIRVSEMASNDAGTSGPAMSAPTAIVSSPALQGKPPASAASPTVTGTPYVGGSLDASTGAWASDTALSYAYQWQRCRAACVNIARATRPHYTPAAADLDAKVRVVVTAMNSDGSASAPSPQTRRVGISSSVLRRPLGSALVPAGRSAGIGAIRTNHGYKTAFTAALPGRLTLEWFFLPKGASLSSPAPTHAKPQPQPVAVATGGAVVKHRGKVEVKLRLTTAGKGLLQGATGLKLTGEGLYAVSGRPAVQVIRSFSLVHA